MNSFDGLQLFAGRLMLPENHSIKIAIVWINQTFRWHRIYESLSGRCWSRSCYFWTSFECLPHSKPCSRLSYCVGFKGIKTLLPFWVSSSFILNVEKGTKSKFFEEFYVINEQLISLSFGPGLHRSKSERRGRDWSCYFYIYKLP